MKKLIQASLVVAVLALSACAAPKKANVADAYGNGSDGMNGAQASGYGSGSGFGDSMGGGHGLAKNTYYFDFDKDAIHDEDMPSIEAHAQKLAANPNTKARLEGYTDPRGSREYNVGLGERRAKAVARAMEARGVNSSQVKIVSYGAERLASPGHSEQDYALDRRAVIKKVQS